MGVVFDFETGTAGTTQVTTAATIGASGITVTGGTCFIQANDVWSGTRNVEFTVTTANSVTDARFTLNSSLTQSFGGGFRIPTSPGGNNLTFMALRNSGGPALRINWNAGFGLQTGDSTGVTGNPLTVASLTAGAMYWLSVRVVVATSTTGTITVNLYDSTGAFIAGQTSSAYNLGTTALTAMDLGVISTNVVGMAVDWDDVQVNDGSTTEILPPTPKTIVPPVAAATLAAVVPAVTAGATIVPPVAAETLAGRAPAITAGITLAPPVAGSTWVAVAPGGVTLVPAVAYGAWAAFPPTLIIIAPVIPAQTFVGFSWAACKAKTGEVIVDLPYMTIDMVRQSIGRYETANASLPIDAEHAPNQWQRATMEGATNIVLLSRSADASGNVISNPVWGSMVTQSMPDQTDVLPITLVTLEGYLDRQFISSPKTYSQVDQNVIAADLITSFVGATVGGIPIRVQIVGGPGKLRDHTYADQDDKSVYSALQDLSGEDGGPEWYIGWEHQTNPERYTPVFYVGTRLGSPAMAGMGANATFEMPGPVNAFQLSRDFSDGKGANVVMAYSSGQGTVRPQSPPQTFTDPERPKFEYRWTPSTSIIDENTLTGYASAALSSMEGGAIALTLSAVSTEKGCPQLGLDWFLGDDIGFKIGGLDANGADLVPSQPGGVSGIARAIGYTLTLADTPILTPVLTGAAIT